MGAAAALLLAALLGSGAPTPNGRAADEQYGQVVLDAFTGPLGLPSVTFDHATHRARHTCRVCHVDLAFALKAGDSGVSATTNEGGGHCGACHDGVEHDGRTVFRACRGWPRPDQARGCLRCHTGPRSGPAPGYAELKARLPVDEAVYIDWEVAERRQLVHPVDRVPGVAVKRPSMATDREVTFSTIGTWLRPVIFSHAKHARWNGCGMCHPEVFPLGGRDKVRVRMNDIQAGRSCGVCHVSVAFPLEGCKRCHAEERRPMR